MAKTTVRKTGEALTWIKRQLCLLQEALLLLWQQAVVEVRNKLLIDSLDYHY